MEPESDIGRPRSPGSSPVLNALVAICVVIELVLTLADIGWLNWPRLRLVAYEYGAFWPGLLRDWRPNYPLQPWLMFVTHGFLHGGLLHLIFNMLTLRSLGRVVIDRVGTGSFVIIFFVTMIGGAGLYAVLSQTGQPMVGASGALFGLAGAIVAWIWTGQRNTRRSIRATWKVLLFLIAINVVMYIAFSGGIAWQTHLGGFIIGWILGLLLDRDPA